jgi:hypothetical protein
MKYIDSYKYFESISQKDLNEMKKSIIDKMDPNPTDVFILVDDHILDIKEEYSTFTDFYNIDRSIVDFGNIDVEVDVGYVEPYTLLHMSNYKWVDRKPITLESPLLKYSVYLSDIDNEFVKYFEKNPDIKPFYTMIIGFERFFLTKNKSQYAHSAKPDPEIFEKATKDLSEALIRLIKRLKWFYNVEIVSIEELEEKWTSNIYNEYSWVNKPPNTNSLMNIKNPRVKISFSANKK